MAFSLDTTLGAAITSATRTAFNEGYMMEPSAGRALYSVETVPQLTKIYDSYVMDGFATGTAFGGNYATSLPTKGDSKTYTMTKITDSFEMIKEIEDFANAANGPGIIAALKGAAGIGRKVAKRIELDLQLNFGFGGSASYTNKDGDSIATTAANGLSIFNSAHTVQGSSNTFSTVGTTAFGQTGLEAGELLFRLMINHDGQQISRRPNVIFSTKNPTLVNLISEYNKGMNHIEDMNRGINVYQGKYDHIAMEFLDSDNAGAYDSTKKNYWGLAIRGDENMKLLVNQSPTVYAPQQIVQNRNLVIQTDAVYTHGFQDPTAAILMQA